MEQPLSPASEGEATDRTRQSITDGDIKQQHTNKQTTKQTNKQKKTKLKEVSDTTDDGLRVNRYAEGIM